MHSSVCARNVLGIGEHGLTNIGVLGWNMQTFNVKCSLVKYPVLFI